MLVKIEDLKNAFVLRNLKGQGLKDTDIQMLIPVLDLCEIAECSCDIRWGVSSSFPWSIGLSLEDIHGGIRRAICSWGENLGEAVRSIHDELKKACSIGTMNMDDKRRWYWDADLNRWHRCDGGR